MSRQFSHFSGIDSCNVGLNCNTSVTSELLCSHESIALAGRPDLHSLLSRKVAGGRGCIDKNKNKKKSQKLKFEVRIL